MNWRENLWTEKVIWNYPEHVPLRQITGKTQEKLRHMGSRVRRHNLCLIRDPKIEGRKTEIEAVFKGKNG